MIYPNTPAGLNDAIESAGGDQSRVWRDGETIKVLPPETPHVPQEVTMRQARPSG